MPRYAALLRGVSPMNASMPALRAAFEEAGFKNVKTVLASGNVVFDARASSLASLERKCEATMTAHLGKSFDTIVRSVDSLSAMLDEDPFEALRPAAGAKRIVTFLKTAPASMPKLPIELDGASILGIVGSEVFSAYLPTPKGPVFMSLIEKTFGKSVTTRTWDTVRKLTRA